ncbi:nicotinate-nucleotide adenylyltransferase [Oharaeibacter diazotrophicus]|uniref:Probable nicotinate-nucleotide adenylyltransferase n=2 Tax=Oharaeibacter diazotrophicus TaxID=1920512 RepID=A0A4R6R7B8_9HYPH|nr:nicotinate-nucleotide adenylyltransferase [Oharaeibacter diazotrophicus]TDP81863.1 nicotinate-nucleotide adenylyltransferase [Oharaeibacter diazotrophicus]BBE73495.1 putative nicotinate-nucleotide adenylyltransferase [Pleomorphomonas sp. SM30]GLS75284.1 putative nicotinate-nucleotide adenylyltransferase [Oharaeibacter diazotrophicus]
MTSARPRLPPAFPGETVGLFGGSFDPPHAGHRHAADMALARLGLDRIWWLVTPGNPLKDTGALPPIAERLAAVVKVAGRGRAVVTDLEARLGTRYTVDLLRRLTRLYPAVRFVLVIGADNWAGFHRWGGWREIAALVPVAVIDRPGSTFRALSGRAARSFAAARLRERDAARLARHAPPAWVFLTGARVPLSSTMLRARLARFAALPREDAS